MQSTDKYKYLFFLALSVLIIVYPVTAEDLECRLLQYKLNRIYFDCGEENHVFPENIYFLIKNNDTLFSGKIENSLPGISYSQPMDFFYYESELDSFMAIIHIADLDTVSPITIGYVDYDKTELQLFISNFGDSSQFSSSSPELHTINGNFLYFEEMILTPDIQWESSNPYDIILSHRNIRLFNPDEKLISWQAPYLVALIPNLSKKINNNGLVTTSLYYRFDYSVFQHIYEGDNITEINSFYHIDSSFERSYKYDPEKGQALIGNMFDRPKQISISISNPNLKKLAEYFADILSRDKIRTMIVDNDPNADCFLALVPYDKNDPKTSFEYIYRLMLTDKISVKSQVETMEIISNYLEALDYYDKAHYSYLTDRSLKYDLGVFPLFRPRIYMAVERHISGYKINDNGWLDISELFKFETTEK